ncbi:MAG TPA: hypothetical protein VL126_10690 [Bacteroidota bacterium]|nr:hypothetical protein [Bacteroidota bacterium]
MGRSSIVYVIGLSLIVGLVLNNLSHTSLNSMNTYVNYYGATQAHNIAVSGANIASSKLLMYGGTPQNFGVTFFGGYDTLLYAINTPVANSVTIYSYSWTFSGDTSGTYRDTVQAVFQKVQFSQFSWFTESEVNGYLNPDGTHGPYYGASDWKITGDSVWGPAHTNNHFNLDGRPYFDQKVTALYPAVLGGTGNPDYHGGYEWNVYEKRPTPANLEANMEAFAGSGGAVFDGAGGTKDVELTFINDQVRVQVPPNGSLEDTTLPISALAPNGVIVVEHGDVHVKGTYQGAVTVAAFGGSSYPNKGNVWIDGNVVAKTDPSQDPSSTDKLGLVAGRMAYITEDDTRNSSSELNLQAAVYCENGELTAQNFWNIPVSGRVNLYGGVTQISAGSLGVFNPGPPLALLHGMSYSVHNDPRFLTSAPPDFPVSDSYQMVSWWEN